MCVTVYVGRGCNLPRETNKKHNHLVKNNTKISVFFNVFVLKLLACVCQYNNLVTFLKVDDVFVLFCYSLDFWVILFLLIFLFVYFLKSAKRN